MKTENVIVNKNLPLFGIPVAQKRKGKIAEQLTIQKISSEQFCRIATIIKKRKSSRFRRN
jgi:hypothetical protein